MKVHNIKSETQIKSEVEFPQSHLLTAHAKECGTTSYEINEMLYLDRSHAQYQYRCVKCGKRIDEPLR